MTFKDKTVCYLKSWDGKRVKAPYYTKHSGRIKLPQAGNICLLIRTINVMNFSNKDQFHLDLDSSTDQCDDLSTRAVRVNAADIMSESDQSPYKKFIPSPSARCCRKMCKETSTGSEVCAGYTYYPKDKQCVLKQKALQKNLVIPSDIVDLGNPYLLATIRVHTNAVSLKKYLCQSFLNSFYRK